MLCFFLRRRRKKTRAVKAMKASKPMPVPIPAFALVLRPEGTGLGEEVVESVGFVFVILDALEGLVYVVCVESGRLVLVVCVGSAELVLVGIVMIGWLGNCMHIRIFPFLQILKTKVTY
jgi:hypothetical protein